MPGVLSYLFSQLAFDTISIFIHQQLRFDYHQFLGLGNLRSELEGCLSFVISQPSRVTMASRIISLSDNRPISCFEPSVGFEFEFAIARLRPGSSDPELEDGRPVYVYDVQDTQVSIASSLSSIGVSSLPLLEQETTISDEVRLSHWMVDTECTIGLPTNATELTAPEYLWTGLEIQSPAYVADDAAINEITRVVDFVKSSYRVQVNESCGLHVHVGNGFRGFPFSTVKKLAAILWAYEDAISTIHPVDRVQNAFSPSLFEDSRIGYKNLLRGEISRAKGLEQIINCNRGTRLLKRLKPRRGGSPLAYNFTDLDPMDPTSRRTIEFRQQAATWDAERIKAWTRLCVGVVEFAHRIDETTLWPKLQEFVAKPLNGTSIIDFFLDCDMADLAVYFVMQSQVSQVTVDTLVRSTTVPHEIVMRYLEIVGYKDIDELFNSMIDASDPLLVLIGYFQEKKLPDMLKRVESMRDTDALEYFLDWYLS